MRIRPEAIAQILRREISVKISGPGRRPSGNASALHANASSIMGWIDFWETASLPTVSKWMAEQVSLATAKSFEESSDKLKVSGNSLQATQHATQQTMSTQILASDS